MRKVRKSLNEFKFGTFVGRFPSDTLAGLALKGLTSNPRNGYPSERKKRFMSDQLQTSSMFIFNYLARDLSVTEK